MNTDNQGHLTNNAKKVINQQSNSFIETAKTLKLLQQSVRDSREFNRKAMEYLNNSKKTLLSKK